MTRKSSRGKGRSGRRFYDDELKAEAVQMLLDGHSAQSVPSNLGLSSANLVYRKHLARAGMAQSMSRAANCYDNAFMESCSGTVKTELEMGPYKNPYIARKEVPDYIRYYNTRRRHSALGCLTPEAFEARMPC